MRLGLHDGLAAVVGSIGLLLAIGFNEDSWLGPGGVCLLSIALCIGVVPRRLARRMPGSVPDFLSVFLAFQVVSKTLTLVSLAAGDRHLAAHEAVEIVATRYALQAEWVHLTAMTLFVAGWWIVEFSIPRRPPGIRPYSAMFLIAFYVVVTLLAFAMQRAADILSLGTLQTIVQYAGLAVVGTLLASDSPWGLGGRKVWLTILMLLPSAYIALVSGSKGELVVVALPLMMAALIRGTRQMLIVLVPFMALMIGIGVPLSEEIRKANWDVYRASEGIGARQGLLRVAERYATDGAAEVIERNLVRFAHRASSAQSGGVVMQVAEEDGSIGLETVRSLPAIFVPRILWPDKPLLQPGAWFTWYLGKAVSPEAATSATAMMLGTEAYWMFGVSGLFLLLPLGALYSVTWRSLTSLAGRGMMPVAGMYAMLSAAVRFEEANVLYAVSSPIMTWILIRVLLLAEEFARRLVPTRARQR